MLSMNGFDDTGVSFFADGPVSANGFEEVFCSMNGFLVEICCFLGSVGATNGFVGVDGCFC